MSLVVSAPSYDWVFTDPRTGEELVVATDELDFDPLWEHLNFDKKSVEEANLLIALYHEDHFEGQRFPGDRYRLRGFLESKGVSGKTIDALIENDFLELNKKLGNTLSKLVREEVDGKEVYIMKLPSKEDMQNPNLAFRLSSYRIYDLAKYNSSSGQSNTPGWWKYASPNFATSKQILATGLGLVFSALREARNAEAKN